MPLLSLWSSNPAAVTQLTVEQVVATAGDGKLRDNSLCAAELRQYFAQAPSDRLAEYATHCLSDAFPKSGLVLQDVVNELGRRLDYDVENGRYQGTMGEIGFDGIWYGSEGRDLVVEVETTDAYRIPLNIIAAYRDKLRAAGHVRTEASVLIVVGREDTGELEPRVRGSRHAWDMRLISVDALLTLVKLEESTEAGVTGAKIRSVLVPVEYTRLDSLVDVMFTTARDVEATVESENPEPAAPEEDSSSSWEFTSPEVLQAKRELIVAALGARHRQKLVKRSRGDGGVGVVALGCVDLDFAFLLPLQVVRAHLSEFNTSTSKHGGHYWHLKILEPKSGQYALQLPKSGTHLSLQDFRLDLPQ